MSTPHHNADFVAGVVLLGQKVKARRKALRLSQLRLGELTGLDIKSVQNVEYGRASTPGGDGTYGPGNPKLDTIYALARALDLDVAYLVDPARPVEEMLE